MGMVKLKLYLRHRCFPNNPDNPSGRNAFAGAYSTEINSTVNDEAIALHASLAPIMG